MFNIAQNEAPQFTPAEARFIELLSKFVEPHIREGVKLEDAVNRGLADYTKASRNFIERRSEIASEIVRRVYIEIRKESGK